MNINFRFLLLGTSLSLIPNLLYAQCAETDCLKLGYTKLEKCDNGLKCPFGEYWACPCDTSYKYTCSGANEQSGTDKCGDKYKSCNCASGYEWKDGKCEQNCEKNGFKYTCIGTGYAGGNGQSCNNKYTSCNCASDYEWKDGQCQTKGAILGQCTGYAKKCSVGQILNSDGTCTMDKVSGKTPIGVVVAINGRCGYAMTANPIKTSIQWSTENVNTGAFQSPEWNVAIRDFDVSDNMTKIIQASGGNSNKYPAAYAALNYAPSAAPTSKGKWALPTAGILNNLYNNLNSVNNTISKLDGTQLTNDKEGVWSSSEFTYNSVWVWSYNGSKPFGYYKKDYNGIVRPVLAF